MSIPACGRGRSSDGADFTPRSFSGILHAWWKHNQPETQTKLSVRCGFRRHLSVFSCKCTETYGCFIGLKLHLHPTKTFVKAQKNKTDECRQFSSRGLIHLVAIFRCHCLFTLPLWNVLGRRRCIVSQRPRYVGLGGWGGGIILLVLCCIRCLEGEKLWSCHSRDIQKWAVSRAGIPETYDSIIAVKFKYPGRAPKQNDHHCVHAAAPYWFIILMKFWVYSCKTD